MKSEINVGLTPFPDAGAACVFDGFPASLHQPLFELRQLIFDTASATPRVGELVETLKWGEPAYLTQHPRSGTTLRLNSLKGSTTRYALYVPCQTTLVADFREIYPDAFEFLGNRGVVFGLDRAIPQKPLQHCIALALTHRLRWSGPGKAT